MSRRMRSVALLVIIAMLVAGAFDADARRRRRKKKPKPLPVRMLACDTDLLAGSTSFRLGNNLSCPGEGLLISGASNLIVDLGGHRLSGPATDNGLRIFGSNNVTVRNGVIDGFDFPVIAGSNNRVTLQNLVIKNGNNRVAIQDGIGHRIIGNTFVNQGSLSIEDQGGAPDPSGIVVSGNTLVNTRLTTAGALGVDDSSFTGNAILGGAGPGITLSNESQRNTVSGNTVIGAGTTGILVTGNEADSNTISGNTVRGHTAGGSAGIQVVDADQTTVTGNRATANLVGIAATGTTENMNISANNATANIDTGILYGGPASGRIIGNGAGENGVIGIDVTGLVAPNVSNNVVNFVGYHNGINDAVGTGIRAPNAVGGGNRVQGSDATDCVGSASLCIIGPPTPPPLKICDEQITAAFTLRYPMVCGFESAISINGNNFTVDLGEHVVDGGATPATEDGGVHLEPATHHVTVRGGLMTGSTSGITFRSPGNAGPHDVTITGATSVGNTTNGIWIQGQDLVPAGATVTAGRNRVENSIIVAPATNGIRIDEAPTNTVTGTSVFGGNGVIVERSVNNVIGSNNLVGGSTGVLITDNATSDIPTGNTIASNRVIGGTGRGIDMQDAVSNAVVSNSVTGMSGEGIRLIANAVIGGSQDNLIRGNGVTGGGNHGVLLAGESNGNQLTSNVSNANDGTGFLLQNEAEGNVLRGNRADENGAELPDIAGIFVADPAGLEQADVLVDNTASRNGFLSQASPGDGVGFGIRAGTDTGAARNIARGNDNTAECFQLTCS